MGEPKAIHVSVARLLRDKKYNVRKVVYVFSPGDKGARIGPSGDPCLTVFYESSAGQRRTALIDRKKAEVPAGKITSEEEVEFETTVMTEPGWGWND